MKKTILLAVLLWSSAMSNNLSAQVLDQGNVVIDAYYGFPNLYTSIFRTTYANSGTEQDLTITGLGPFGIRGEYLLTSRVGLGIDIGYNNSKISYNEAVTEYDIATGLSKTNIYKYDFITQKLGVMVTFNFHFIENEKVDFYGTVGVGYGNRTFDFSSTDPNYIPTKLTGILPVAARTGVGVRYFFTPNIGASLAAGVGQGGLLNTGISFKL